MDGIPDTGLEARYSSPAVYSRFRLVPPWLIIVLRVKLTLAVVPKMLAAQFLWRSVEFWRYRSTSGCHWCFARSTAQNRVALLAVGANCPAVIDVISPAPHAT